MYKKEEVEILHRIQDAEFEMFRFIDGICTKHNIAYYLWGGTLIGAIRHNDFIPWDDDFDIVMYRTDYEKFKQIIVEEGIDERFEFATPFDDLHFTTFIPTLFYKNSDLGVDTVPNGRLRKIHLDIFILDKTSDIAWIRELHCLSLRFVYGLALGCRENKGFSDRFEYSKCLVFFAKTLALCGKIVPYKWLVKLHEWFAQIYNSSNTKYLMCTNNAPTCLTEKHSHLGNVYQYTIRCPFRDITAPIPAGYDVILKSGYGDYMTLPPEENRKTAHANLKKASVDDVKAEEFL